MQASTTHHLLRIALAKLLREARAASLAQCE
jgi:hypothetical protein